MIELVTTDGLLFRVDGGEWEVTNNIWLVGDDREVVVIDAAHDADPTARWRGNTPARNLSQRLKFRSPRDLAKLVGGRRRRAIDRVGARGVDHQRRPLGPG